MMSEAERQYYLGKAGISIWYARAPLPGAAPSPEFRFPVEDSVPEPESDPIVPQPARRRPAGDDSGRDRIAGIQALMADSREKAPDSPKTPESPKPVEAVELPVSGAREQSTEDLAPEPDVGTEPDSQVQIEARLGFWVSERMVLVSGVSDDASARLQDALAENILAALGDTTAAEPRHIRWPVFGNPRVPGNSVDDLQDVLGAISKEFATRKLLLLGVLVDDLPSGRSEWLVNAIGTPAIDFPRTLAELAAVPAYKRELWQQLKSSIGV